MTAGPAKTADPGAGSIGPVQLDLDRLTRVAAAVPDPELPVVTIGELGILRDVSQEDGRVIVTVTPTYSGCPAMAEIRHDVHRRLMAEIRPDHCEDSAVATMAVVEIRTALQPAWTSDWITAAGRRKLAAAGIAPPGGRSPVSSGPIPLTLSAPRPAVSCPLCGSPDTDLVSQFGASACRALYRCRACTEPFEYLKAI